MRETANTTKHPMLEQQQQQFHHHHPHPHHYPYQHNHHPTKPPYPLQQQQQLLADTCRHCHGENNNNNNHYDCKGPSQRVSINEGDDDDNDDRRNDNDQRDIIENVEDVVTEEPDRRDHMMKDVNGNPASNGQINLGFDLNCTNANGRRSTTANGEQGNGGNVCDCKTVGISEQFSSPLDANENSFLGGDVYFEDDMQALLPKYQPHQAKDEFNQVSEIYPLLSRGVDV